ncbi:MAG: CvpA family protein [Ruminococcus sp.]|nr:CvpA family protein [Ruminococcus sp.]
MIYDVITLLIILLFVIIGAVRGAAKTLLGLLGAVVSFVGAVFLGRVFADMIYNGWIKNSIIDAVTRSVSDASGNLTAGAESTLPDFLKSLLALSGENLDAAVASTSAQAANAVEQTLGPIIIAMMAVILTVVLFLILAIILKLIMVKPLTKLFEDTPLKGINRFFGGVLGLVEAVLTIRLLAYLLKVILPVIHPDSYLFSESTIYNSYIFYHFYSGNIFTVITSIL